MIGSDGRARTISGSHERTIIQVCIVPGELRAKENAQFTLSNSPTAAVHSRGLNGSKIEEQRTKIKISAHESGGWGSSFFDFRSLTNPQGGESRWSSQRLRQRKLGTSWGDILDS